MVEVTTGYRISDEPFSRIEDRYFASLGKFPEQFPIVAGGDTPLEAVAAAVDESHRAYGNALPKLDAEADEDSYSVEQI